MTTRDDVWIKATAGRLERALGDESLGAGHGYSADECVELAEILHDMSLERSASDMPPSQRMLYALLRMQDGVSDAEALILAGVLGRIDIGRLLASSRTASEVIDINEVTLLRHRLSGHIDPAIAHSAPSGRRHGVTYWLHHLLYIVAYVRQRPPSGGPNTAWPDDLRL